MAARPKTGVFGAESYELSVNLRAATGAQIPGTRRLTGENPLYYTVGNNQIDLYKPVIRMGVSTNCHK